MHLVIVRIWPFQNFGLSLSKQGAWLQCLLLSNYLLERHFQLLTDHSPLQWLSAQKMEGFLCRWVLAMQEYDFTVKYRKGNLNANANALSHCTHPKDGYFVTCKSAEAIFNRKYCRMVPEICRANKWNDTKKDLKLLTVLEGEALAVWIELTDDEQKDYSVTKKKIKDVIMPM